MRKTSRMLDLEERLGKDIAVILAESYARHGRRGAYQLGLDPATMYRWMERLGLVVTKTVTQAEENEHPEKGDTYDN